MKKHNKSGISTLSILEIDDKVLEMYWLDLSRKANTEEGLVEYSPCFLTSAKDGRYSHRQEKICHAYHLAAWKKYGRESLLLVPSNKASPDSLVISHLCGNGPRCFRMEHLVLEAKIINDERTHCHFCLKNACAIGDFRAIKHALEMGICPHVPPCCTQQ